VEFVKPFVAKIGPPRLLLGLAALVFGVFGIATDTWVQGSFDWTRNIKELIALIFSCCNIGEEMLKFYLRHRFPIIVMDAVGIFDRRIMKQALKWEDIEWVDPQPGGLPDRLRVKSATNLTAFGRLRNRLIRLVRRIPDGEVVITFGGLNKAASQATTWIADNIAGLVPNVWKSAIAIKDTIAPTDHDEVLISARVDNRKWVGWLMGFIPLVGLFAGLLPAVLMTVDEPQKIINLPIWAVFIAGFAVLSVFMFGLLGAAYWAHALMGDKIIVISKAGFSDARISSQFISWGNVESASFQYRDMGRLVNEGAPIGIQFREGIKLASPAHTLFWPFEMMRRILTPELRVLSHFGTTTTVSEIVEILQRNNVSVAIREVARG
jgi:hypothetical protein